MQNNDGRTLPNRWVQLMQAAKQPFWREVWIQVTAGLIVSAVAAWHWLDRSEEHTSELQSPCNLVCRLLLEKKKKKIYDLVHARIIRTDPMLRCHVVDPAHPRDRIIRILSPREVPDASVMPSSCILLRQSMT